MSDQPESLDSPSEPEPESGTPPERHDPLRQSLTSRAWIGIVVFGLLLVLLIVFIAQNTQSVKVSFLGWTGHAPLAVALLIAAAASIITTAGAGTLRILQLRRRVNRASKAAKASQPGKVRKRGRRRD